MPLTKSCRSNAKSAFTFVELSIVLVIAGLLAGGILAGKGLIEVAEMRSQINQINNLKLAMISFQVKFNALPGDMTNVSAFYSGALNGNGNGEIEAATSAGPPLSDPENGMFNGERSEFFRQLGLAGYVQAYDGSLLLGHGYPELKLHGGTGMMVTGPWQTPSASNMSTELYTTRPPYLFMGICDPSQLGIGVYHDDCAIFTAREAYDLDAKLDDGSPITGAMVGESSNTTCLDAGHYAFNQHGPACNLMFSLR